MKKFMKNKMDMSSLKELDRKQEMKAAATSLTDLAPTIKNSIPVNVKLDNTIPQVTESRPILQPIPGQPPLPLGPPPPDSPKLTNVKTEIEDADYDQPTNTTRVTSTMEDLKPKLEVGQSEDNGSKPPICRDYIRGTCTRNGSCKFTHELILDQLHRVYTFCRNFQNSTCKHVACKFVHATVFEEQRFYRTGELPEHTTRHLPKEKEPTVKQSELPQTQPPPPPVSPQPQPLHSRSQMEKTPVSATMTTYQYMPPVVPNSQMMTMNPNQLYNMPPMTHLGAVPNVMQFKMPPPNMSMNYNLHGNMHMVNNMVPSTSYVPATSYVPTQMLPPNTNPGRSHTNPYSLSNSEVQNTPARSPKVETKGCRNCKLVPIRLFYHKEKRDQVIHTLQKQHKKSASLTRKRNKIFSLIVAVHNKKLVHKPSLSENTRMSQDKNLSLANILAMLKDT